VRRRKAVNRSQFKKRVADELKHIPAGDNYQNMFRSAYHDNRRHLLADNPDLSPKGSLLAATELVRAHHPDVQPVYDKEFFEAAINNPTIGSKRQAKNRPSDQSEAGAQIKAETKSKVEGKTKPEAKGKPKAKAESQGK
jgi:hypothetical protein